MKYVGPLYAKLGGKYVKLREDSEYVDRLERENANMKRAAEIQAGVFENTVAENAELQKLVEQLKPLLVALKKDIRLIKTRKGQEPYPLDTLYKRLTTNIKAALDAAERGE